MQTEVSCSQFKSGKAAKGGLMVHSQAPSPHMLFVLVVALHTAGPRAHWWAPHPAGGATFAFRRWWRLVPGLLARRQDRHACVAGAAFASFHTPFYGFARPAAHGSDRQKKDHFFLFGSSRFLGGGVAGVLCDCQ